MADNVIRIPVIFEEDTTGLAKSAAEIDKVKASVTDLGNAQKKAFDVNAQNIDEWTKAINEAGTELSDLEVTTKGANKESNAFAGTIKEQIRGLNLFGVNIGQTIDKLKAKQTVLRGVVAGLNLTTSALKVLKIALISTGIGAIVVALGSLVVFLTKTQKGMDFISRTMAGVGAGFNVVISRIADFGEKVAGAFDKLVQLGGPVDSIVSRLGALKVTFTNLVTGLPTPIILALKAAFGGLAEEITNAVKAGVELEAQNQKLREDEREFAVLASKKKADIDALRESAIEETKGFRERIKLNGEAREAEIALNKETLALAERREAQIKKENELQKSLKKTEDKDAEAQAVIKVQQLKSEASRDDIRSLRVIQALKRQAAAEAKRLADEERKREQERVKVVQAQEEAVRKLGKELAQQVIDEEQLAATEQERLQFQKESADAALKQAEEELSGKLKALGRESEIEDVRKDFARLRFLTAERYEKEITKVVEEEAKKQFDATVQSLSEAESLLKNKRDKRLEFLEKDREIDEMRIDLLKESGNAELTLEQFKEDAKLRLLKHSLEQQRQTLIDNPLGLGFDDLAIEKLGLEIEKVEGELKKLETLSIFDRIKTKFLTIFKIDEDEAKLIGEQLNNAIGSVFEGLTTLVDSQIEQQQRIIDKRQEAVDELQNQLNEELRLKEQGVANNSDLLKTQLAEQTALLKAEEEKRLELEKKAAKIRLRQNALELASTIALSVAKAIEANAKFGLVGIVTAAAQIASIFLLIAKARAQAAAFKTPELREGKKLTGPSHEQGGVDLLVSGASGGRQLYEAEGDEWLVGTKPSREHDSFLNRLNDNEFTGRNLNRDIDFSRDFFSDPKGMLTNLAPQFGIPIMPDIFGNMLPKIRETVKQSHVVKQEREREMIAEVMQGAFAKMGIGLERLEKAITEKPEHIPLTELGYMTKKKTGNTTTVSIHEPPKRRTKT